MSGSKHQEVITFKVDETLKRVLKGIENRSEFIRNAILAAVDNVCPFCKGTGVLTMERKKHWNDLVSTTQLHECDTCHEYVVDCEHEHQT